MRSTLVWLSLLFTAMLLPASAAPLDFYAFLNGASEAPPNGSTASGSAFISIDPMAHTMRVQALFSGLSGGTTAAHIHVLEVPSNLVGPVATTTPTFSGFPAMVTFGSYDMTFDTLQASTYRAGFITAQGGVPEAEAVLFNGIIAGDAYFNIHSTVYPGGEIRGFLQPVPEPATIGLTGAAVGIALVLRRRRIA